MANKPTGNAAGESKTPRCPIHERVLVCPACMGLEDQRSRNGTSPAQKKQLGRLHKRYRTRIKGNPILFSSEDCLKIFKDQPGTALNAEKIKSLIPKKKQDSAKHKNTLFAKLQYLYKAGQIERVGKGEYRLTQAPETVT